MSAASRTHQEREAIARLLSTRRIPGLALEDHAVLVRDETPVAIGPRERIADLLDKLAPNAGATLRTRAGLRVVHVAVIEGSQLGFVTITLSRVSKADKRGEVVGTGSAPGTYRVRWNDGGESDVSGADLEPDNVLEALNPSRRPGSA